MNEPLQQESERLARSWLQHQAAWLRDYLVAGVEDPRTNIQSLLSRHFLIRHLAGARLEPLMEHEYRFAAAMNWLRGLLSRGTDPDELRAILDALQRGSDNAEVLELPAHLGRTFRSLPAEANDLVVPNYLLETLSAPWPRQGPASLPEDSLNTFCGLWTRALAGRPATRLSVFEPACGSANDYRFLHACGLGRLLDYTGIDLCPANIDNARALFPGVSFQIGNVFELAAPDRAFEVCFVHDLFEHLSLEGLETAIDEICGVTRRAICASFFNLDDISGHVVQPVEDYHWNTLSLDGVRKSFARNGFAARVLHIGTFLRKQVGCIETHNPNAWTLILERA